MREVVARNVSHSLRRQAMTCRTLAALAAITLAGCAIPLRNGDDAPTLTRKTVTQKLMPDTLVAFDGTRCTTTSGRFRDTSIRSNAWCLWLVPPRAGTAAALRR